MRLTTCCSEEAAVICMLRPSRTREGVDSMMCTEGGGWPSPARQPFSR